MVSAPEPRDAAQASGQGQQQWQLAPVQRAAAATEGEGDPQFMTILYEFIFRAYDLAVEIVSTDDPKIVESDLYKKARELIKCMKKLAEYRLRKLTGSGGQSGAR